jgi:hypothetical protein
MMATNQQMLARVVDLFGPVASADPTKLHGSLMVSPSGNILIGSTTDSKSAKLQVNGASTFSQRPTWGATPWDSSNLANPVIGTTSNIVKFDWGSSNAGQLTLTIDSTREGYLWHSGNFNPSNYVTTSGTAAVASKLNLNGGANSIWNWSGQSGQPTWVWGGSDGTNMYVYNPSNFSVSYAASAGSVGGVSNPIASGSNATLGFCTFNAFRVATTGGGVNNTQGAALSWNDGNGDGTGYLCCNQGSGSGGWVIRTVNSANSVEVGRFTISGSGVGTNGSDKRLKKNIRTLTGALEKIRQIRGVSYTYRSSDEKHYGVIAQEVLPHFPDAVTVTHDTKRHTDLLGVAYTSLVAPLIEAVKELADQLDEARARISVLEGPAKATARRARKRTTKES